MDDRKGPECGEYGEQQGREAIPIEERTRSLSVSDPSASMPELVYIPFDEASGALVFYQSLRLERNRRLAVLNGSKGPSNSAKED